jgi:transcriptional regulator of acetoin/glycerol metabolism
VRTVTTSSGATAVQIVSSSRRGSQVIEHIGSAHDVELEVLNAGQSPGGCSPPLEFTERDAVTRRPARRQREQGESRRWLGMSRATICRRIREYGIIALAGV